MLPGLKHLDGIVFAARIMVEASTNPQYRNQNRLANVVQPDEPQHAPIMRGETVPAEPVNAPPRKAANTPTPGWQAPTPAWGAQPQAPSAGPAWGAQAPAPQPPVQQPPTQQSPASLPSAPGTAPTTGIPAWLNG